MVVFDAKGKQVMNVIPGKITREAGEIVFQPTAGPGEYFVYFMPNGGLAQPASADKAWQQKLPVSLPSATVLRFESRLDFHRRDPMELIATAQETAELLANHPQADYLVFPEDRRFCVRMFNDLPYRWIHVGPSDHFSGKAAPNEYYTFQIGVYACRKAIADIHLEISNLKGLDGATLPANAIRCINAGGVDWAGRSFAKPIGIGLGTVKPLWFVVDVPEKITAGTYRGTVKLSPVGKDGVAERATTVALDITVCGDPVPEHGCLDAWRMSRLGWLDSTKGEEDTVVAPYIPVAWHGNTAKILNRSVKFNALGLPQQIVSGGHDLLVSPVEFMVAEDTNGSVGIHAGETGVGQEGKSLVTRNGRTNSDALPMEVRPPSSLTVALITGSSSRRQGHGTRDITLDIPMRADIAEYFMGLGLRGALRPKRCIGNGTSTGHQQDVDWQRSRWTACRPMHNQDIWRPSTNYRNGVCRHPGTIRPRAVVTSPATARWPASMPTPDLANGKPATKWSSVST